MSRHRRKSADQLLSSRIQKVVTQLMSVIEPDDGFIDLLVVRKVLSSKRATKVRKLNDVRARNNQLISYLLTSHVSERKCQDFVDVLKMTDQLHVFHIISPPEDGHDIGDGIPLSGFQMSVISRSLPYLVTRLAFNDDLVAEMMTSPCVTENQLKALRSCAADSPETVRKLIDTLTRRSVRHFRSFIECVRRTQPHLVPLLTGDTEHWFVRPFGSPRPLDDAQLYRLFVNRDALVDCLRLDDGLVARLSETGCVTDRQRRRVESRPPGGDRTRMLLDVISRASVDTFGRVVAVLCESRQQPLVITLLTENVVAVRVDMQLLSNLGHATITSRYSALHRTNSRVPDVQLETLESDLNDLELGVAELGIAAIDGGTRSYLVSRSLAHVIMMRRCWDSGLVRDVLERIFRTLCGGYDVTIERWTFDDEGCSNKLTRLGELARLPAPWQRTTEIAQLPFEMQQLIIAKSIVARREALLVESLPPRVADSAAVVDVSRVCLQWYTVTADTLRRYARRLRQLFRMRPQLIGRIRDAIVDDVSGIAVADDRIFVACRQSANIRVFRATSPHERLGNIPVADRVRPADIAVLCDTVQLYVADEERGSRGIWRLNVSSSDPSRCKVMKLIRTDYEPYTLSIAEATRRILVVPGSTSIKCLYVYDADDGHVIRCVQLPSYVNPLHAVEVPSAEGGSSSTAGFVVSYTMWRDYRRYHCVSELDALGRLTVVYNGGCDSDHGGRAPVDTRRTPRSKLGLYWPLHVAVDSERRVLVACVANGKIMGLETPLNNKNGRVMIAVRHQRPRRLWYVASAKQLIVGLDGEGVDILQL